MLRMGIDVGSTTVKIVVLDEEEQTLYSKYERHFSNVRQATKELLEDVLKKINNEQFKMAITGSAGMGLSESTGIPFIQEVIACTKTVETYIPETDVVIELGGEDAKITFFDGALEQRMNGSCAGGTGAFIDQMAILLKTDANGVNELAKKYQKIYPIASRCGVFAKTDIQPLINEGAAPEDIAASIYQAVVNQTIAGLAAGRKIKGNVAFLGGPLSFSSELRRRFIETLEIQPEAIIFPKNSQLFVAIGAAIDSVNHDKVFNLKEVVKSFTQRSVSKHEENYQLEALFQSEKQLQLFRERHEKATVESKVLADHRGVAFLGIDAGSTTTKVVLINELGQILYQHYGNNEGKPLETTLQVIADIYQQLPTDAFIGKATVTGYGEHLIKHALKVDLGEVETMAHYKAANKFYPGVDFILDIGGQDMKAMTVNEGVLTSIQLNEACSSGCGSFIETFAQSMNYPVEKFAKLALLAKHPVDLGSRCTVFMNSKVKQVQKEGASVGDISAGLSYSVIKNAMYKVIKVRRPEDLGDKIVCQGGTFYNEAVLRAFELISGKEVVRPAIAGLMGAYGSALIALEEYVVGEKSTLISLDEMNTFNSTNSHTNCGLCENNCLLTITHFSDGRQFVSGNRCERGANIKVSKADKRENMVEFKYRRLFKYRSLSNKKQTRGVIGLPRVLNMYENYPLWHTVFTDLGFRVELSPRTDKELYELGIETISSDTVCYPAKLVHGHIQALILKKVPLIFYPGIIFERQEFSEADNHFNCPVVQSYPDVIKNNVDEIRHHEVDYRNPFLNLAHPESVKATLFECFKDFGITALEMSEAVEHGFKELDQFQKDIQKKGEEILTLTVNNQQKAIVLAGRPYHIDPEVNKGIANIMNQEGFHVLTEDGVSHLGNVKELRVVNQWTYHSRLYAAAKLVAKTSQLELVQLNSFGCGIDAVTTDQVEEIMSQMGRIYTVLKIDEGSNLGAIRIRLRSLKASIKERDKTTFQPAKQFEIEPKIVFTKEMRKKHTLLLPMLSPIHQEGLVDLALKHAGYNVVCLPSVDPGAVDTGLKYVNNDSCYPAIISIGQLIKALQSGAYDLDNVSVMMTQTGGGCRATNYIPLLRKALKDAGFANVPVVSISMGNKGVESQPGFKLTLPLMKRLAIAFLYGDLFERVVYRTRPYEKESGQIDQLHKKWLGKIKENVKNGSYHLFRKNMEKIISDFDTIALNESEKPKVGVVGEILVKYSPVANNDIVRVLEAEGAEVVVPDIAGFMLYSFYNSTWKSQNIGESKKSKWIAQIAIKAIEQCQKPMDVALRKSQRFTGLTKIDALAKEAQGILSIGNQTGEGWFLTGEMMELLNENVTNIVCLQPFGCLPNHVVGKGVIKELRSRYNRANIVPIDYDPGVSIVNQLNRIKLMMATAQRQMK